MARHTFGRPLGALIALGGREAPDVQADPPPGVVRLSSILRFCREDSLPHGPSLVAYVNRCREEPIREGHRVEFIPYDWTLQQR